MGSFILPPGQLRFDLHCQRWNGGRDRYTPAQAPVDTARLGIERIKRTEAEAFVQKHHYSASGGGYARRSYGVFFQVSPFQRALAGVMIFGMPSNARAISARSGLPDTAGLELTRLVLVDEVEGHLIGGNAESWSVTRALRALRADLPEIRVVLAYSDPVPRWNVAERRWTFRGHVGTVYQALPSRYIGRATARTIHLLPNGAVLSERTASNAFSDKPKLAAINLRSLERQTGDARRAGEDWAAWKRRLVAEGRLRPIRHRGNHTYLLPTWTVGEDRALHRALPAGIPDRPKKPDLLPNDLKAA